MRTNNMNPSRLTRVLQDAAIPLHQRSSDANAALVKANEDMTREIAQLRLRVLELEHAADTDPLVPVYNRRAFLREIARAQTVMQRYDMLSTIIFFDLNAFKSRVSPYGIAVPSPGWAAMNSVFYCSNPMSMLHVPKRKHSAVVLPNKPWKCRRAVSVLARRGVLRPANPATLWSKFSPVQTAPCICQNGSKLRVKLSLKNLNSLKLQRYF
jgi:hypothetical protein